MKQLLNNIQTRLKTEIPTLFVDEDWGQLDYFMPAAPVKYPCALIHVGNIRYQTLGHKLQHGVATVVITVADVKFTNTSSNAPPAAKTAGLESVRYHTGRVPGFAGMDTGHPIGLWSAHPHTNGA